MDPEKRNIICDLDGTISLDDHRHHFLTETPKRWPEYFEACDGDTPNWPVLELLEAMRWAGYLVTILSGREATVKNKTIAWLTKHRVHYITLKMRPIGNRIDDHILKVLMAQDLGLTPTNTLFVLEDRNRVVEAWRARGYTCFQVALTTF
jgi:hypothetical protein